MGRIDTKSRLYLQQKEVFADAFNYYIYDGKPVIRPEELEEQDQVHYALPVRNMLYDALRYKKQVEERASFHRKAKDANGRSSGTVPCPFMKCWMYRMNICCPWCRIIR